MQRAIGYVAALFIACLLVACATADVSGHRVSTATAAVRFSSADVIFLHKPSLKRTDLGGFFANPTSYSALSDRVVLEVRHAMSEARDGVQAGFAAHGIQGGAYLASDVHGAPNLQHPRI